MSEREGISALWMKEDWWAVWLGLGIIAVATLFFYVGGTLGPLAVSPPRDWTALSQVTAHVAGNWPWYFLLFVVFGAIFTVATSIMGHQAKQFVPGFALIFLVSVLILVVSQSQFFHTYSLEAPLVALILGLLVGNFVKLPEWLDASLRTEFYIKTGIVLLGATLPLTLIITAGPIAFLQATIVSVCTWLIMFFVATRVFNLDKRFGAVLGAGGAVCGVSASIAVGGAVKADKEHVAISISIVSLWALVMIFFLPLASKALGLHPGVAGAWIGTSEFADAAGYAAAQTIASASGNEAAIQTF
ncbi:MAG: putative sulfate exporter family transporter, partial [Gemmatimonadales bacterium]